MENIMVTLVGTEDKINEAIAGLVELEYDVINSFKFAINKINSIFFMGRLKSTVY
jgi:hypothetical protein